MTAASPGLIPHPPRKRGILQVHSRYEPGRGVNEKVQLVAEFSPKVGFFADTVSGPS